jgi:hypothetical protein
MTGTGRAAAHWTNGAHWSAEQPGAIALQVTLAQAPYHDFDVLLDPAEARRLVIVLTRLLMERDSHPTA